MPTALKSKKKGSSPENIAKSRRNPAASEPLPLLELHARPGNLIRRCHQIAVAIFLEEAVRAGFGTTPVQCTALLAIREQPGLDQTRLVNLIALDRSTVGNVVEVLQVKRLIRRRPGRKDRRTKRLYLTDAGRAVLEVMEPAINRVQERILSPLEPAERKQFLAMLAKLVKVNNTLSRAPLRPEAADKITDAA